MTTRLQDLLVPEVWTPYAQFYTTELSALVQSGALVRDAQLDALLAGAGLTYNQPSFDDLENSDENVSTDDPAQMSTPDGIQTLKEIQVRLSRNKSWSSMDLNTALIGPDPLDAIARLVGGYRARRLQKAFLATLAGVFADNDAAPSGADPHTQGDLTFSLASLNGGTYQEGLTDFGTSAFMDAIQTMGDAQEALSLTVMHSVVYNRAKKNNLIDFIPDSANPYAVQIPTFNGRRVVVDDGAPNAGGLYDTLIFGAGAVRLGQGNPKVPTEVERKAASGNGGGQETLYNRWEWIIHPVGHAYKGTAPDGGPSNSATANNLAHADSWTRAFPERKAIRIARLRTREHA